MNKKSSNRYRLLRLQENLEKRISVLNDKSFVVLRKFRIERLRKRAKRIETNLAKIQSEEPPLAFYDPNTETVEASMISIHSES